VPSADSDVARKPAEPDRQSVSNQEQETEDDQKSARDDQGTADVHTLLDRIVPSAMRTHQNLEQTVRNQFMQGQHLAIGLEHGLGIVAI
jgi:hypothetical protein